VSVDRSIRTGRFVDVQAGIRLHCAEAGDPASPPLLLLHGFPEFWYAWRDVLPRLADRWHAVAPDLRGFNLSSRPADVQAYRVPQLVADLDGLIRGLGHERVVVVAHDWGGVVAWALAIAMPHRVSRLVIVNAPHPVPFARQLASDPDQQAASAYMNWLRRPGAETALARDDYALMERFFVGPSVPSWFDAPTRAAYHAAWGQAGALAGSLAYYRASPLHPPAADAPGAAGVELAPERFLVRVPTLVVWGEQDRALRPGLLEGLDAVVPELTVVRLPECSHWVPHEAPERLALLVDAFAAGAAGPR
jgi:pimeloyl-ACP methyl ester carboxylesterase